MANLISPPIDWGGQGPQSIAVLVLSSQIAPAGVATYTGGVLTTPAANQLFPPTPEAPGMYVWQATIQDLAGNIVAGAGVEVRDRDSNALVAIFSDLDGEEPLTNPFTVGSDGLARFYAGSGMYNVRAFFAGEQQIWRDVLLGVRMEDIPDLTAVIEEVVEPMIADAIAAIDFPELPDIPEGQILFGVGRVNADGSELTLPFGWTSSLSGSSYTITHNGDLDANEYSVVGTAITGAGHANFQVTSYAADSFTVRIFGDENDAITSHGFAFAMSLINPDSV